MVRAPKAFARIGRILADASYYGGIPTGFGRQSEIRDTFGAVFPELSRAALQNLVKAYWRSQFQRLVEQNELESMSAEELVGYCRSRVQIQGREQFRHALQAPEPIVIFAPHYGNFMLAAICIALEASEHKKVHFFYNPTATNVYAPTVARLLSSLNRNVVSILNDRSGVLKAVRALGRGELVGIMPDVDDAEADPLYVPFFGKLTRVAGGAAFLAHRWHARLVPVYCYRQRPEEFVMRFDSPVPVSHSDSAESDLFVTTSRIFQSMEEQFRRLPQHWWFWDSPRPASLQGLSPAADRQGAMKQLESFAVGGSGGQAGDRRRFELRVRLQRQALGG